MKKRKGIQINISNRAIYTLIAVVLVSVFAIGVYAYGTPGPASTLGHSASEIELPSNVCRTNGTGCNFPTAQADLGLYVNPSNQLCFPTSTSSSCTLQSATCSKTGSAVASGASCSGSGANAACLAACQAKVACNGTTSTQWSCGTAGNVYYTNLVSIYDCLGNQGDYVLYCSCSVSGVSYQNEVPQNSRCV